LGKIRHRLDVKRFFADVGDCLQVRGGVGI
jgi:hypothetical protein